MVDFENGTRINTRPNKAVSSQRLVTMPPPRPRPNRHHYRFWIKQVVESDLIEKLPKTYESGEPDGPYETTRYARKLMAELGDPSACPRPLEEIVADAREFKSWVEARRKEILRRLLVESRPEDRIVEIPPRRKAASPDEESRPEHRNAPKRVPNCTRCGTIGSIE